MKVRITLNGGPANVWANWGLRCNPFPQIPSAEFATANRMLQALDSDPLQSSDEIRTILAGCDPAFVDLCVDRFKPGERVQFSVTWPD